MLFHFSPKKEVKVKKPFIVKVSGAVPPPPTLMILVQWFWEKRLALSCQ